VLRINALEDNVILFEYVNGERFARVNVSHPVRSDSWYRISVEIDKGEIRGCLDDRPVIGYATHKPLAGYVGVWTKADSVTYFHDLTVTSDSGTRSIPF
jgi:pyruvate,water dikinase